MKPEQIATELNKKLDGGGEAGEGDSSRYPNLPDIIYKSFDKEKKKREPQDDVTFAPSYLSKCGRAIYYDKTGTEPTNPPNLPSLLKMHWGNLLHQDTQKILQDAGILESFEVHKTKEWEGLTFNYFYDGILNIEGTKYIMEIKTVYASGYKSIEDAPKPEHVLQAISYMKFEGIDRAIILYAGRDNGYLKQHKVQIVEDFVTVNNVKTDYLFEWNVKISKMVVLKRMIGNDNLPLRDYSIVMKNYNGKILDKFQKDGKSCRSDWQCNYCSYRDKCWASELKEIEKHTFFIDNKFS